MSLAPQADSASLLSTEMACLRKSSFSLPVLVAGWSLVITALTIRGIAAQRV
jgi:hypothetical protein